MSKGFAMTKREEELMDFMWNYHEPVTSNEILDLCSSRSWSESYLQVMLRSLLGKGMLAQVGMVRYGTQYARQFQVTMSKEEYFVSLAAGKNLDKCLFARAAVAMALREAPDCRKDLAKQLRKVFEDSSGGAEAQ